MATTIISNQPQYTFGSMTIRMISGLIAANSSLERLKTAIATASAGTADDGRQFEISNSNMASLPYTNLFGIVSDQTNPGQRGKDYQYAMNKLDELWGPFWEQAKPFIEQLDQGTGTM